MHIIYKIHTSVSFEKCPNLRDSGAASKFSPGTVWITGQNAFCTGFVVLPTPLEVHVDDFLREAHH